MASTIRLCCIVLCCGVLQCPSVYLSLECAVAGRVSDLAEREGHALGALDGHTVGPDVRLTWRDAVRPGEARLATEEEQRARRQEDRNVDTVWVAEIHRYGRQEAERDLRVDERGTGERRGMIVLVYVACVRMRVLIRVRVYEACVYVCV